MTGIQDQNAGYREYKRLSGTLFEYVNHPDGTLSYYSKFFDEEIMGNEIYDQPYSTWLRNHANYLGVEKVQQVFISCLENRIGMMEDSLNHSVFETSFDEQRHYQDQDEELAALLSVLKKSGLPYVFDRELFCIVEGPETKIDEYFFDLHKDTLSEVIDGDLGVALEELKKGSAEGCFAATRRYTIRIKFLEERSEDWKAASLPFNNGNFKSLANHLFGILSNATKTQSDKTWTMDEARFLLRISITLDQYLNRLDTKHVKASPDLDSMNAHVPF